MTAYYDLNGNRTGAGYVIGPDNQLLSDGTYNYTYDADGNEATKTNIATGDQWTYAYNNNDQLVSAIETSANGTVETQVVIQYDVFGNRLEEQVWTPSTAWTTTRYAYDAWDPATPSGEGNENWKVWATLDGNNDLETRYINGDALDQVFAQVSAGGAVAWYLTDRLGSTVALVDNDGNVLDAITYDAWGNITSQTNPSAEPLFTFAGMAWDAALDLDYDKARFYSPLDERFVNQDPTQYAAGDSNLYRYVGNDPTNVTDPSGLAPNKQGTTDPSHLLNRIRELEARGLSRDEILATIRNEHGDNNNRYFYTDKYGWVDIRHFAEAAIYGHKYGSTVTRALGFANEVFQWATEWGDAYRSDFSPEDLPSNNAGATFGAGSYGTGSSLSEEVEGWLKDNGARDQNDPLAGRKLLPRTDPSVRGGIGRGSNSTSSPAPIPPITPKPLIKPQRGLPLGKTKKKT